MTREAAVLGTPAYNLFVGKPSAVDDYLVDRGRMVRVSTEAELDRVQLRKKDRSLQPPARRTDGLERILAVIAAG